MVCSEFPLTQPTKDPLPLELSITTFMNGERDVIPHDPPFFNFQQERPQLLIILVATGG